MATPHAPLALFCRPAKVPRNSTDTERQAAIRLFHLDGSQGIQQ